MIESRHFQLAFGLGILVSVFGVGHRNYLAHSRARDSAKSVNHGLRTRTFEPEGTRSAPQNPEKLLLQDATLES